MVHSRDLELKFPPPVTQPVPGTAAGAGGEPGGSVGGSPAGDDGQLVSQPQLHMEEEAEASVECHSVKPCTRGEETGLRE